MSYDNTNKGALFKNDRQTHDRQPNLRGSVNVEGVEYWVSAWTKTIQGGPRQGEKMISVALQRKDDQPAPPTTENSGPSGHQPPEPVDDFDDDIPF
jgi:hypothetical protein